MVYASSLGGDSVAWMSGLDAVIASTSRFYGEAFVSLSTATSLD
jgi:hypothetical protein